MSTLYTQLQFSHPDKQIRLLGLEPSPTGADEYVFSMEVHDFQGHTRPSYITISYTWGLPDPKLSVVVNSFRMRVQFNCWYALWQMRHHEHMSNTKFWIDSLCINQSDDEEKGNQVAIMGEIFSSASSVAASLGIGESLGNVRGVLASADDREIGKLRLKFDQLPCFDRVWVKQEIILAKEITIFYGLESLSWSEFDHAVKNSNPNIINSQSDNSDSSSDSGKFRHFNYDRMVRERLERNSISAQLCNHRSDSTCMPSAFMDLIPRYSTAKASVAVDKIYALLSLLPQNDPIRQNLLVEYG
ncbi:het domain protein [Colletotrichum chrysophilum]|uniref:Het domain protein n=1 Tax=Colletotrichum chrysophilum TaxID=1836956 RepID=A0AAD9APR7_9PEZI|nr:het domain protein [Colletotrichum chrysophilum]